MQNKKQLTFNDLKGMEIALVLIPMIIIFFIGYYSFGLIGGAIGGAVGGGIAGLITDLINKRRKRYND